MNNKVKIISISILCVLLLGVFIFLFILKGKENERKFLEPEKMEDLNRPNEPDFNIDEEQSIYGETTISEAEDLANASYRVMIQDMGAFAKAGLPDKALELIEEYITHYLDYYDPDGPIYYAEFAEMITLHPYYPTFYMRLYTDDGKEILVESLFNLTKKDFNFYSELDDMEH